jgi:hypothetical protein
VAPALVLAVLLLALTAPAAAAAGDGGREVTYSVATAGAASDAEAAHFAAVVDATLADPRGWSLGGRLAFRRVDRGGTLRVRLAEAAEVAGHPGCSPAYSCAAGPLALVNLDRWRGGAPTRPGPALRHPYRQHVINHEVGHVLGFGHATCPRAGAPAPLMQQQSKGLLGCVRNAWPLAQERRALAVRRGITPRRPPPRLRPGRSAGGIALGDRRGDVRARVGAPLPSVPEGAVREEFPHARLAVGYRGDAVGVVTTRAAGDRTAAGIGVGTTGRALRAALPRARCADGAGCVLTAPDGTVTTFRLRAGAVAAVRVAAPAPAPAGTGGAGLHPLRPTPALRLFAP